MAIEILNADNIPIYRSGENLNGFEWLATSFDATGINAGATMVVVEQIKNFEEIRGPQIPQFTGITGVTMLVASPGPGATITYDKPNPPVQWPVGKFLIYW